MEITITNLNDNVNRTFLESLLRKYGAVEECCIYYHPKTKKHLGTARVTFFEAKAARLCKEKLDNASIMGNLVHVIEDAFGKCVTYKLVRSERWPFFQRAKANELKRTS